MPTPKRLMTAMTYTPSVTHYVLTPHMPPDSIP